MIVSNSGSFYYEKNISRKEYELIWRHFYVVRIALCIPFLS